MPSLLPDTELERLAALASYDILDTPTETVFDDLANLAARLAGSKYAAVTLLDDERVWLKAAHGRPPGTAGERKHAFCSYAILEPDRPMIVNDLAADPRFTGNPFVDDDGLRSYLGVPLVNPEGHALGTLCVIDSKPRPFDSDTVETIKTLARAVSTSLELRRALRRANAAASTDVLTNLANRRTAIETVEQFSHDEMPFATVAIDLDFFKEINDRDGHAAGDAVLKATAERLRLLIRQGDLAARIGGDEFVVILRGIEDRQVALGIAQRISASLHAPVEFGGKLHRVGATLGLALFPQDVRDGEQAVRVADDALMRAKREKRGSIGIAVREDTPDSLPSTAILSAFETSMRNSGEIDGATLDLQPIVALTPHGPVPQLVAIEALARWHHPSRGMILPATLFPIIGPERAVRLSQLVRDQALAAFRNLHDLGVGKARLALNLSASEVMRPDTALRLTEQVEQAGLSLLDIEIEITEEVLLERVSNRTLDQLAALRGRGARLILDDFGTGNSGLAQLMRLPLDGLKLDKQFVQRLGADSRAEEIIRATISLAHSLKLDVVAEGIETEHQAGILRTLGCDAAQGFLFAYPMQTPQLRTWLQERNVEREGVTILHRHCA